MQMHYANLEVFTNNFLGTGYGFTLQLGPVLALH